MYAFPTPYLYHAQANIFLTVKVTIEILYCSQHHAAVLTGSSSMRTIMLWVLGRRLDYGKLSTITVALDTRLDDGKPPAQ